MIIDLLFQAKNLTAKYPFFKVPLLLPKLVIVIQNRLGGSNFDLYGKFFQIIEI